MGKVPNGANSLSGVICGPNGAGARMPEPGQNLHPSAPSNSTSVEVDMAACCGQWLAVAAANARNGAAISIMDVTSCKIIGHCTITEASLSALAMQSGSDGFMVTGAEDGKVRVWGVPGCQDMCDLRGVLIGHKDAVICIAIGCNAHIICTGSKDGTVRLWRRQPGAATFAPNVPAFCEAYRPTGLSSLCCDGARLVYVHKPDAAHGAVWEQSAAVWDLALGKFERSFFKKDHSVNCVALCGTILATSSATMAYRGCAIQLWHAPTGHALSMITNPAQVTSLFLAEPEEDAPP